MQHQSRFIPFDLLPILPYEDHHNSDKKGTLAYDVPIMSYDNILSLTHEQKNFIDPLFDINLLIFSCFTNMKSINLITSYDCDFYL